MYIRSLILLNSTELAKAVPIVSDSANPNQTAPEWSGITSISRELIEF